MLSLLGLVRQVHLVFVDVEEIGQILELFLFLVELLNLVLYWVPVSSLFLRPVESVLFPTSRCFHLSFI